MSDEPAPISAQYREMLNTLASGIDEILNGKNAERKRLVFCLVMAEAGNVKDGRVNYISNGARDDMTALLTELLAKWNGAYSSPVSGQA